MSKSLTPLTLRSLRDHILCKLWRGWTQRWNLGGTPNVTFVGADVMPSAITCCCRFRRKLAIQWNVWRLLNKVPPEIVEEPVMWYFIEGFWEIHYNNACLETFCRPLYKSYTNSSNWVSQDLFPLKPCCLPERIFLPSRCHRTWLDTTCSNICSIYMSGRQASSSLGWVRSWESVFIHIYIALIVHTHDCPQPH